MAFHALIAALAGASALAISGGALATIPRTRPLRDIGAEVTQASADYPIYDSIVDPLTTAIRRALAEVGIEGTFPDARDAAAVAEYYAEQGYTPVWTVDGKLTEHAKEIVARIKNAAIDGLDPAAYPLPPTQLGAAMPATIQQIADADVELSA